MTEAVIALSILVPIAFVAGVMIGNHAAHKECRQEAMDNDVGRWCIKGDGQRCFVYSTTPRMIEHIEASYQERLAKEESSAQPSTPVDPRIDVNPQDTRLARPPSRSDHDKPVLHDANNPMAPCMGNPPGEQVKGEHS